jgi:hypothetical protein
MVNRFYCDRCKIELNHSIHYKLTVTNFTDTGKFPKLIGDICETCFEELKHFLLSKGE